MESVTIPGTTLSPSRIGLGTCAIERSWSVPPAACQRGLDGLARPSPPAERWANFNFDSLQAPPLNIADRVTAGCLRRDK